MPERVWYRSLYWRIALGYVALLAVLLLVQTGLSVWLTDRMWGGASRTPEQLAELVAQDLSAALAQSPQFDLDQYLRDDTARLPAVRRGAARRHAHVVEPPERDPAESRTRRARASMGRGGDCARRPPDGGRGGGPEGAAAGGSATAVVAAARRSLPS